VSEVRKPSSWVSLARAAEFLDESPTGFRKKLDRASSLDEDGLVHATLPGLRARKFGKLWKVRFDRGWL
jgi:hypothetical protein